MPEPDQEYLSRTISLIGFSRTVDILIVHLHADLPFYAAAPDLLKQHVNSTIEATHDCGKPVIMVLTSNGSSSSVNMVLGAQKNCIRAGVPVYPNMARAALAISRLAKYRNRAKSD